MVAVVIDQVKLASLEMKNNLLLKSEERSIPEGYVSEEEFWEEFDKKLLASYGKI